jgi:uncharacterized damage-inducible protein DinB
LEALVSVMVTPAYVHTMAAYNAEMNRRLYEASARIPDAERRKDRGAFWGSLHGTLCHLLWGDQAWMSRFDNWPKPDVIQKDSAALIGDFDELRRLRAAADEKISAWAGRVTDGWLAQDMVWFSSSVQREMRSPRSFAVTHFFNHQTHHRGQAHALITACGEKTGDTDLFLVVPNPV